MPTSIDVVNAALQKVLPTWEDTFTKRSPLMDHVVKAGNFKNIEHPYLEFLLLSGGPGVITQLHTGDEFISSGRTQGGVKGNEYTQRWVYSYDVPLKDYDDAQGKADIMGLLKSYDKRAIMHCMELIAQQMLMGTVAALDGVATLNGDATYNPGRNGSRSGLIAFKPKLTQTHTVHGVQANSHIGWHNQYRHITSMGQDGKRQFRGVLSDCAQEGQSAMGTPDIALGDRLSYANWLDRVDDQVVLVKGRESVKDGLTTSIGDEREGVYLGKGCMFYEEQHILTDDFVTPEAQDGVVYFINSEYLNFIKRESTMGKAGFLKVREPKEQPNQDVVSHRIVSDFGMYTNQLRVHGAVTGGHNE